MKDIESRTEELRNRNMFGAMEFLEEYDGLEEGEILDEYEVWEEYETEREAKLNVLEKVLRWDDGNRFGWDKTGVGGEWRLCLKPEWDWVDFRERDEFRLWECLAGRRGGLCWVRMGW